MGLSVANRALRRKINCTEQPYQYRSAVCPLFTGVFFADNLIEEHAQVTAAESRLDG